MSSFRFPCALLSCVVILGPGCDAVSSLMSGRPEADPDGVAQPHEEVAPKDPERPRPALDGRDPLEAAPSLVSVEGANINVGSAESDGQRMFGLSCKPESGGLMGGLAMVGVLAAIKTDLDACAPKGGAAVVYWEAAPKATKVDVEGADAAVTACVSTAMEKVTAPFRGACGVVLVFGETAGANAALEGLYGKE